MFETVQEEGILPALEAEFLENLYTQIHLSDENGQPFYTANEVVQSSTLSPLFFNIYAEKFIKALKSKIRFDVSTLMFADDTAFILKFAALGVFLKLLQ